MVDCTISSGVKTGSLSAGHEPSAVVVTEHAPGSMPTRDIKEVVVTAVPDCCSGRWVAIS